jgi:hypothetical protein
LWENGNRISQFIQYPDEIPAGTVLDVPVATIDLGPTFLDYAGITASYSMDGISWRDAITDSAYESYLANDRCLFFEMDKDRAVRCGCNKYLHLYSQDSSVSDTYKLGLKFSYAIDIDNVFDLCDGTSDYVTEPTTNMEETNLYTNDSVIDSSLADRLNCHMTRTDYAIDPDFSDCNNPSNSIPTSSPTQSTPSPTANPTIPSSPTSSSTCIDSTLRFKVTYNGKKMTRDCTWVANKQTSTRCNVDGISSHCPSTCGVSATSCCVDSSLRFKLPWNGKFASRDCTWVANRATALRCAVEGVAETCPATCGECS